jgi:CYTH domain-containing protein
LKYLLASLPAGVDGGVEILQGYLSTGDPEVRVRSKGGQYFVTRKGGEGFIRTEDEEEVSMEVFEILWPATSSARVEKTRFKIVGVDGLTWEVDEYYGNLKGLFTAEVELPSSEIEAEMPVTIAEVLVADVTEDKRYKNKALAVKGIPA